MLFGITYKFFLVKRYNAQIWIDWQNKEIYWQLKKPNNLRTQTLRPPLSWSVQIFRSELLPYNEMQEEKQLREIQHTYKNLTIPTTSYEWREERRVPVPVANPPSISVVVPIPVPVCCLAVHFSKCASVCICVCMSISQLGQLRAHRLS